MYRIGITDGGHDWSKQNLVTIASRTGSYDLMKCTQCGMTGKRKSLDSITLKGIYSLERVMSCIGRKELSHTGKIKITNCQAFGKEFVKLTPGSEHDIVTTPTGMTGVWVMGVTEPVKVLPGEFTFVK